MKCYEEVTTFRTMDGVNHETAKRAESHIMEKIGEVFLSAVKEGVKDAGLSMSDSIKITESLIDNRLAIRGVLLMEHHFDNPDHD